MIFDRSPCVNEQSQKAYPDSMYTHGQSTPCIIYMLLDMEEAVCTL